MLAGLIITNKRFRPLKGQMYYYIQLYTSKFIIKTMFNDDGMVDKVLYKSGNMFSSPLEARRVARRLQSELKSSKECLYR